MAGPGDELPPRLWRAIVALPVVILCVGIGAALLLAAGAADPPLPGPVLWERQAPDGECLDPGGLDLPALQPGRTLEASAASVDHAAWGVQVTAGEQARLWEVLAPGYYRHAGRTIDFHHVHAGFNLLRLDLIAGDEAGDRWRLWLNRERAAEGALPAGELDWRLVGMEQVCLGRLTVYGLP